MEKPKILIVDDDPDLRRGLNLRLRANHFDTAYATDGFSAITSVLVITLQSLFLARAYARTCAYSN